MTKTILSLEDVALLEHIFIGPTWRKNEDGSWYLPNHTLGWQIAAWCATFLNSEDGGPWRFTLEQLRFILWWYAVDKRGRFVYRKGVLQRMKGWGKDPLLAVICLVELVGPSRFSHFGSDGVPVGKAHPRAWVQVTAVNQSQTTNTMELIPSLMSDLLIETFGIKPGAELIRANGGRCRLEAVTSSYRACEGKRTTFTVLNETHHWVKGNNGHKMYEVIDNNAAKQDSRYLAITNAYLPGEDSVAEQMRGSWEKIVGGQAVDTGYLYDSLEAHPETPLTVEALEIVLPIIRGDAVWLSVEAITQSIQDTTISISRSRRMWLNQITADEDALYTPQNWRAIEATGAVLRKGDEIVLGFDGGKSDDATALVGLRASDRVAFVLCLEEKPDGPAGEGWEVDRDKVDSAVRVAFRDYKVKAFYADVALWESYLDDWAEEFGESVALKASERHAFAWDMRQSLQRVTRAHERLLRAVHDKKVQYDGNPNMYRHALNVFRRENNYGVSFGKESRESPRKVDLYAALLLAHEALHNLRTRGSKKKELSGRVYFI